MVVIKTANLNNMLAQQNALLISREEKIKEFTEKNKKLENQLEELKQNIELTAKSQTNATEPNNEELKDKFNNLKEELNSEIRKNAKELDFYKNQLTQLLSEYKELKKVKSDLFIKANRKGASKHIIYKN